MVIMRANTSPVGEPGRYAGLGFGFRLPLDALEEDALFLIGVLVGVDDVALVLVEEVGDRGHQPLLVGAR